MMKAFTPQQWAKFRQHVLPGCRCYSHMEGFLLENWPYDFFERSLSPTDPRSPWYRSSYGDLVVLLRYQPYKTLQVHHGSVLTMHYWINGQWHTFESILAFPDED
jgi:hypothetical protein